MSWAAPIRHDLFRTTAGNGGDKNYMRAIVLHFEPGSTRVDGFACSACDWFYVFLTAEPDGTLSRREVDLAHAQFAQHRCEDFPKVRIWDDAP